MLYHQIIAFLLIGVLCNVLLNLRTLRRAEAGGVLPDPPPLISVLIPARNEEANIGACLDSLRRQDYPNFEILVLDDSSSDGTADIVSRVAAEDSRVRLLTGEPLPLGWAGKPFACHQLAQEARGSWLLFTDADTVHAPSALSYVLCAAISSQAALVSGFPLQLTTSFWQKMAMPLFFYFLLLCGLPFWWLQRSGARPMPSLAIGQFMFFSAPEYRSIGGHEAVKSHIIEDVELGMEMWRHKYRQLTLDLTPLVSCQMYREFGSMWQGINRWLYTVASMSALALIVLMAAVIFLFLMPFIWLAYGLLLAGPLFWIVLQVVILLAARFLAGRRFSQPVSSTILHPFGMGFVLLISVYATYQYLIGAGVRWKGRVYDSKFKIS
ncbi:MAG TPA: glycosyltransferase [Dehalococcoidia bacterium]|nr:glycosyltransferase [Dehalococcoidia bacterium]